jgi:hypothetical protein
VFLGAAVIEARSGYRVARGRQATRALRDGNQFLVGAACLEHASHFDACAARAGRPVAPSVLNNSAAISSRLYQRRSAR